MNLSIGLPIQNAFRTIDWNRIKEGMEVLKFDLTEI
jgi:hypothetical protein